MPRFTAQPPKKGALQRRGVEPVCLGPSMFARNRDTVGVDDMGLYVMHSKPAREPESIAAGLEGNGDTRDFAPGPDCLVAPAVEQFQKRVFVGFKFLQRVALDTRHHTSDQPT